MLLLSQDLLSKKYLVKIFLLILLWINTIHGQTKYGDESAYWEKKFKLQMIKVFNQQNLIYYSNLYFWDHDTDEYTELQFIMDTGSSWVWAPTQNCNGCPTNHRVPDNYFRDQGEGIKTLTYGSGSVQGDIVRSTISLVKDKSSGIPDYKMLRITQATLPGFANSIWDGIIGLLPTSVSGSDLFVTELYKAGVLAENSFGMHLTNTSDGSEITFGGYDQLKVPDFEKFAFNNLDGDNYWASPLYYMKYGYATLEIEVKRAVFDSGSSWLILPSKEYSQFITSAEFGKECYKTTHSRGWFCESAADFEPLYFHVGYWELRAKAEDYIALRSAKNRTFCEFSVAENSGIKSKIILGAAFLRNYYTYYDVGNQRIGFHGDYQIRTVPPNKYFWLIIVAIVGSSLILLGIIAVLIYIIYRKHRRNKIIREFLLRKTHMSSDAPTHQEYDARKSKVEPIRPAFVHVPSVTDSNVSRFGVGQFNKLKLDHNVSAPVRPINKIRQGSFKREKKEKPVLGRISSHQPQEPHKYEFELDSEEF